MVPEALMEEEQARGKGELGEMTNDQSEMTQQVRDRDQTGPPCPCSFPCPGVTGQANESTDEHGRECHP